MKKIVIIDDNSVLRQVIKHKVYKVNKDLGQEYNVYSSDNGVEGLGLVFTTRPDMIIVDITLPKYSGNEVVDFLVNNDNTSNNKIIILYEKKLNKQIKERFPEEFALLSKNDPDFIKKLSFCIAEGQQFKNSKKDILLRSAVSNANNSDLLVRKWQQTKNIFSKVFNFTRWIIIQLYLIILTTLIHFMIGEVRDDQIKQASKDNRQFRVRAYPTLASIVLSFSVLVFQVAALATGGLVVLNNRFISVFADSGDEIIMDLNLSSFDANLVEIVDDEIALVNLNEKRVLAVNQVHDLGTSNFYSNGAEVTLTEKVLFTDILYIYETSNLNRREISTNKPAKNQINGITYQLSPDNQNWYYYSQNQKWDLASGGTSNSNNIQQVNAYLEQYEEQIGDTTGELYLKMFFNSDGDTEINLEQIQIIRNLEIVTPLK